MNRTDCSTGCFPDDAFSSWRELCRCLDSDPLRGWIFRGLARYDFHSSSSLERLLIREGMPTSQWISAEKLAVEHFKGLVKKLKVSEMVQTLPADDDTLGWMSLMQHYGAPTRLIDWTKSRYVACWFAYANAGLGFDSALWLLNADFCRSIYGRRLTQGEQLWVPPREKCRSGDGVRSASTDAFEQRVKDENGLIQHIIKTRSIWPLPIPIVDPDDRMKKQEGCFVCLGVLGHDPPILSYLLEPGKYPEANGRVFRPTSFYCENGQTEIGPGHPPLTERPCDPQDYIIKIRLRHEWRNEAMQSLTEMGITADNLFPGLDGVGRSTELFIRNQMWSDASMSIPSSDC